MANPCNREIRTGEEPYAVFANTATGWTWEVLKFWNAPENAASDRYARVMCRVSSPYTYGGADIGDCYLSDLLPQWNRCDTRSIGDDAREWLQRFYVALDDMEAGDRRDC
jgi:hypothetical protein